MNELFHFHKIYDCEKVVLQQVDWQKVERQVLTAFQIFIK